MNQIDQEGLYQQQLFENRQEIKENNLKKKADKIIKISEIAQEIEVSKVTMLLRFILILSIMADLLGIIPVVGNIFGIFFGAVFLILYFLNGLGRGSVKGTTRRVVRKRVSRWIIRAFFLSAEGIPILGILPFFTIMALVEIALSQRTVKKLAKEMGEVTNNLK